MAAAATATARLSLCLSSHSFPFLPKRSPLLLTTLFSSLSPQTLSLTLDSSNLSYGPSLHKGTIPTPSPPTPNIFPSADGEEDRNIIDRDAFARSFQIAALRVPADSCSALESRLRGHLLNWPRVRNVARVPGDDIDPDFDARLLPRRDADRDEDEVVAYVERRVYGSAQGDGEKLGPVLYREKLVKTFNCRGFLKFRNLAKISRPKVKRKKKIVEKDSGGEKRIGKNDFVAVEVVSHGSDDDEDLSGLLGEEFRGARWRGPTRLLLLDERYADKGEDELPEAVKVAFCDAPLCVFRMGVVFVQNLLAALKGDTEQRRSICELVQCKLTLFYDYWQLNEILEALLPEGMIVPASFEAVGHIAHLNLRAEHLPYRKIIAQVVLDKNRPKIQTVVNKSDMIQNDYRTMQLEVLAGNHSLVTTVVENGVRFHFDLATVYWNSRLATERQRLINSFTNKDVVCDVFSGVGPLAILAAKKVNYVHANDLNPSAIDYLERNVVLNKLDRKIEVDNYFCYNAFRGIYKKKRNGMQIGCVLPRIHVYGFSKAQDPEFDFLEPPFTDYSPILQRIRMRIRMVLSVATIEVEMRRVRLVAPGKWMLCASFILPEVVACARY
ncbi:hypothetical protein ACLOJK_039758 [Asimina triloba]